jgi:hypothetical protein
MQLTANVPKSAKTKIQLIRRAIRQSLQFFALLDFGELSRAATFAVKNPAPESRPDLRQASQKRPGGDAFTYTSKRRRMPR